MQCYFDKCTAATILSAQHMLKIFAQRQYSIIHVDWASQKRDLLYANLKENYGEKKS